MWIFKNISKDKRKKKIWKYEIPLSKRTFTAVDEEGNRRIFGKKFTLYAGTCQPDKLSEKLTNTTYVSVEIHL